MAKGAKKSKGQGGRPNEPASKAKAPSHTGMRTGTLMMILGPLLAVGLAVYTASDSMQLEQVLNTKQIKLVRMHRAGTTTASWERNMTSADWRQEFQGRRVLDEQGIPIGAFQEVRDGQTLYSIDREGRNMLQWMWPSGAIGTSRVVNDIDTPTDEPIELVTLSLAPKVFFVHNFMSEAEMEVLRDRAVSKDNPYSMRPSTTGHKSWVEDQSKEEKAASQASKRTSENAFVIDGAVPTRVRKRAFELLRMPWSEKLADGLQVLRYEKKQAYVTHSDYFDVHTSRDFNWNPVQGGSNRYATVFLYLSDVEEGGETVFPKVRCDGVICNNTQVPEEAEQLMGNHSWEMDMTKACSSSFRVKPRKGSAILFYSQLADGSLDPLSEHGACPVLKGQKWGANMWAWNACRFNMCSDPLKPASSTRKYQRANKDKYSS